MTPTPKRRTRGPMTRISPHGLTPKQAAQRLDIPQEMLAAMSAQGAIPSHRPNGGWTRYQEADLRAPAVLKMAAKLRRVCGGWREFGTEQAEVAK